MSVFTNLTAKELRARITPCPVCGRMPYIKAFGVNYARIRCKPWYRRKAHLSVWTKYCQPSQLVEKAIEEWNKEADCARLPVW